MASSMARAAAIAGTETPPASAAASIARHTAAPPPSPWSRTSSSTKPTASSPPSPNSRHPAPPTPPRIVIPPTPSRIVILSVVRRPRRTQSKDLRLPLTSPSPPHALRPKRPKGSTPMRKRTSSNGPPPARTTRPSTALALNPSPTTTSSLPSMPIRSEAPKRIYTDEEKDFLKWTTSSTHYAPVHRPRPESITDDDIIAAINANRRRCSLGPIDTEPNWNKAALAAAPVHPPITAGAVIPNNAATPNTAATPNNAVILSVAKNPRIQPDAAIPRSEEHTSEL